MNMNLCLDGCTILDILLKNEKRENFFFSFFFCCGNRFRDDETFYEWSYLIDLDGFLKIGAYANKKKYKLNTHRNLFRNEEV